jgi:hypothetical protein
MLIAKPQTQIIYEVPPPMLTLWMKWKMTKKKKKKKEKKEVKMVISLW